MSHQACTSILLITIIVLLIILFGDFSESTNTMLQYYLVVMSGIWLIIICNYDRKGAGNMKSMYANAKNKAVEIKEKMNKFFNKLSEMRSMKGDQLKQTCNKYIEKLKSMPSSKFKDNAIQTFVNIRDGFTSIPIGITKISKDALSNPFTAIPFINALGSLRSAIMNSIV